MNGDIVEGRNRNHALLPPNHIIVKLGMASGENDIKIFPVRSGLGEPQPGVAVGDNDMLLVDIVYLFILRILCHALQNIKNDKFRVVGIAF